MTKSRLTPRDNLSFAKRGLLPLSMPTSIALWYVILSSVWVFGSGWALHFFVKNQSLAAALESLKGLFFILITALLLRSTLEKSFRRLHATLQHISEREERLRLITETIDEVFWMADLNISRMLYVSPAYERIWGRSTESLYAEPRSFIDAIHPEDQEQVKTNLRAQGNDRSFEQEYRIIRPDGSIRWISDRGFSLSNGPDQFTYYVGVAKDITERKLTDLALRESEERFSVLFHASPAAKGISRIDDGRFLDVNEAFVRLYGFEKEEILGRTSDELGLWHSNSRLQIIKELQEKKSTHRFELQGKRKDGAVLDLLASVQLLELGGVPCVVGSLVDITEVKQAEAALKRSEQNYREIFDATDEAIFLHDTATGRILDVNNAMLRLYGFDTKQEVISGGFHISKEHAGPYSLAEAQLRIRTAHEKGPQTFEWLAQKKSGEYFWVEVSLRGSKIGGEGRVLAVVRDITKRRQAEQALRERERQLQIFVHHSPAAIAMLDREMRYLVTSRRWLSDYRLTGQCLTGRSHYEVFPEIPERWKQIHRRCLAGAIEKCDADPFPRPDGTIDWVRWEIRPWRTADGEIGGLIVFSELITEQKQMEAALRQSEQDFRAMFEVASIGIAQANPSTGQWLRVNRTMCRITGYSEEELLQSRVSDLTHPEDRARDWELLQRVVRGELPNYHMEKRYLHKDGSIVWVRINVTVIRDAGGQVLRTMATIEDISERRRTEEALRLQSAALEAAANAIVITDRAGKIEWVNPAFATLSGFSAQESVGKSPRLLRSGQHSVEFYKHLWTTILGGEIWHNEIVNRRKDGSVYHEEMTVTPLRDSRGEISHFIAIKQNITERKRLEAFRRASLDLGAKLNRAHDPLSAGRALLEASDKLWKWDAATVYLVQPEDKVRAVLVVDIVDGKRQELPIGRPLEELTGRMREVIENGARLILRDASTPESGGGAVPFGDLTRLSESIMVVPIHREAKAVGILSIQSYEKNCYTPEDLRTFQALADYCGGALERIQAEQALRSSEERYRGLVEATSDWIWELDAKGRYVYTSPQVEDLMGWFPEEILGTEADDLMTEENGNRFSAELHKAKTEKSILSSIEHDARHRSGRAVTLETSCVPIFTAEGELSGYRGISRDVTERKQLEAQFRQAQKLEAIGQLAGGVAHDFNNILAAIMMHLGLLQMSPNLTEEMRNALKDLEAGTLRASGLTRQLLMFSRRSVLAVKALDLNEVVANLLKMLNRLIGEQIDLRFDSKTGLPMVEADAGMLEQVLMNLVVNARDAMPKGGRITISTSVVEIQQVLLHENPERRPGSFLCLEVLDTGCGMDQATLKRIFEPFFTTKESGKGTGLGLATVHGIVAQHQGWVEVDSELGRGTCFRVFLPASGARVEKPQAINPQPVPRGHETILLVEDEEAVRRLFGQALRILGYQVLEAGTGQEALTIWNAKAAYVDLLLTDMVMPEGMTGLELAEQLQSMKPGLKAIISSGYSAEIVQAGVPNKPGLVYLPKPYNTRMLAEVVRSCLDRPGSDKASV